MSWLIENFKKRWDLVLWFFILIILVHQFLEVSRLLPQVAYSGFNYTVGFGLNKSQSLTTASQSSLCGGDSRLQARVLSLTPFNLVLNLSNATQVVHFTGYVDVPENLGSFRLVVDAEDCLEEFSVNGHLVFSDPECGMCPEREFYLDDFLKPGTNRIDVIVRGAHGLAKLRVLEVFNVLDKLGYATTIFFLIALGCFFTIVRRLKRKVGALAVTGFIVISYAIVFVRGWIMQENNSVEYVLSSYGLVLASTVVLLYLVLLSRLEKPKNVFFAIVLVIAIYLLPIFVRYDYWGGLDWEHFQSYYQSAKNAILHYHQFPFWNPYICGGSVQLAAPEAAFVTPFFVSMLLFDVVHAIKLNLFLYLVVGALGCCLLSKKLNFGSYSTLLFALSFVLGGFFAFRIFVGWVSVMAISYLPYILLFYWESMEKARYIPLASLFLALFILEANPFLITLMMLFLVFYPLFLSMSETAGLIAKMVKTGFSSVQIRKQDVKLVLTPILNAVVISFIAFLIAGFRVVPALYFALDNPQLTEDGCGFNLGLLKDALTGYNLPFIVLDNSNWWELSGYVGTACLLLSFLGILLSLRDKKLASLFLLLVFITLYSFSQNSPLNLWAVFHTLPLFSSQHVPARSIAFMAFILPLFAGVGMARIEKANKNLAKLVLAVSLISLVVLNMPVIANTFTNRQSVENLTMLEFRQDESKGSGMYKLTLQGVGVTDYHSAGCLANKATPVNDVDYKGESYLLKGGYAKVLEFSPNEVKVVVNTSTEDTLVLNQNYYKGWYSDNIPARDTNGLVSADVYPGTSMVVFHYYPQGLTLGLVLTSLGIFISIAVYRKKNAS